MKYQFKVLAIIFLLASMMSSCSTEQKDKSTGFKQQFEKYVEFWNTGQFDNINDILSEDFELRMTPQFESEKGIDTFMENVTNWRKAYPDFHLRIDEIIYSNNAAAVRWTITATNTGSGSHPPTGKRIEVPGISIVHFTDGKIKDEWIASNDYYWLKQLGFTLVAPSFEGE
ncbi:MAG: ester cyclase [Chlorobi bacterium]|nr:ester cyclase [Chlorobiota bacterium]